MQNRLLFTLLLLSPLALNAMDKVIPAGMSNYTRATSWWCCLCFGNTTEHYIPHLVAKPTGDFEKQAHTAMLNGVIVDVADKMGMTPITLSDADPRKELAILRFEKKKEKKDKE